MISWKLNFLLRKNDPVSQFSINNLPSHSINQKCVLTYTNKFINSFFNNNSLSNSLLMLYTIDAIPFSIPFSMPLGSLLSFQSIFQFSFSFWSVMIELMSNDFLWSCCNFSYSCKSTFLCRHSPVNNIVIVTIHTFEWKFSSITVIFMTFIFKCCIFTPSFVINSP